MTTSKKQGSLIWALFWLIMFWPIAVVYILSRKWTFNKVTTEKHDEKT